MGKVLSFRSAIDCLIYETISADRTAKAVVRASIDDDLARCDYESSPMLTLTVRTYDERLSFHFSGSCRRGQIRRRAPDTCGFVVFFSSPRVSRHDELVVSRAWSE